MDLKLIYYIRINGKLVDTLTNLRYARAKALEYRRTHFGVELFANNVKLEF